MDNVINFQKFKADKIALGTTVSSQVLASEIINNCKNSLELGVICTTLTEASVICMAHQDKEIKQSFFKWLNIITNDLNKG